ncbi:MAG TPA: nucleotide sugar dehydrogenase [Pseudonocardia sp.]|nr:nucleotide sugar dehydrogenase [Pseudonocardia sp.]
MNDSVRTGPAISVFGLGYVGCVSAACFADRGFRVLGIDANPTKTEFLRDGKSPVIEDHIGELVSRVVKDGALTVVHDAETAVHQSDISLICVGTPSEPNGELSTVYLRRVAEEIGAALATKAARHTVVFRSTMVPGTCEGVLIPILEEASGKRAGVDFGVCVNPEFLREGTSVWDFNNPPKTVVGSNDPESAEAVMRIYEGLPGPRFAVRLAEAEMIKYVDNSYHALKVAFGNEIGVICRSVGVDSHSVIDVFMADTKLNISPAYLRPGFAFGGSCLPKDLRALVHTARRRDLDTPLLASVLPSNEAHIRRALDLVTSSGRRKVGIFGLSFKAGTDDLRESALVELAERLLGKGYQVKIYDSTVALSRLTGANRDYLAEHLPHIERLLTDDIDQVLEHAEVCIAGSAEPAIAGAMSKAGPDRLVVDLVRLPDAAERREDPAYVGISW